MSGPVRTLVRVTIDIEGYLARLGVARPAHPSTEALFALHRAHAERVAYENVEIQLGRATSVDPAESIARIARGGGGYCFHLNGALGALLAELGFAVTRHLGEVRVEPGAPESGRVTVNHQVVTATCEGESYLVDVGLGDGLHEPMRLAAGTVTQGPFTYRLEHWAQRPGGWVFWHDPRGAVPAMVFASEPVHWSAFAPVHQRLSTSPESGFVRVCVFGRRPAGAMLTLRGLAYKRVEAGGVETRTLESAAQWFGCVAEEFGTPLAELGGAERERLWARLLAAHEQWAATGR